MDQKKRKYKHIKECFGENGEWYGVQKTVVELHGVPINVHRRILMEDIQFYFFTIIVYHLDEVQNCAS